MKAASNWDEENQSNQGGYTHEDNRDDGDERNGIRMLK